MNILQIVPEMKVGGVERGTYDLAIALVRRGHKAVVVSNGGELADKLWGSGVLHYQLPVHEKNLVTIWKMIRQVREIIGREKIDIVHARSRVPAWIGFWASRKTPAQFLTTCHGYYSKHFSSRVMGWGKLVIAISHAIGRRMVEDFKVPRERIRLIPRGVDLTQFHYRGQAKPNEREKEILIGMIARVTPLKGHGDFLKAAAKAVSEFPNLRVWIIGDSQAGKESYLAHLKQLARRLGLARQVEFLGYRSDIAEILKQLDVLVLPTVTPEAFGRVLIEAQAAGVPVIGTRVGGVVEVIENEKTGLLVPPSDPLTLSAAILRILKDPSFSNSLVQAARRRVEEEFSLEKMVEKTVAVYEELLRQKRILMIKISSLGDVILAIPSLRAVREAHPQGWIAVLTRTEAVSILRKCPYVDEVIVYDPRRRHQGWIGKFRLGNELRRHQFGLVIDLQNNRTSRLAGFLSLAPFRYGYKNGKWSFLLSHACKEWKKKIPPVEHQFQLLRFAGISPREESLQLWFSKDGEDEAKIEKWLANCWVSQNQKLVAISPFTSQRWMTKRWNFDRIAELTDRLGRDGVRTVLVGAPGEEEKARDLIRKTRSTPLNAVGKTSITELGALLRRCKVLLTHDSASLHVAAAAGTPFIALFGPTDPKRHLPPYREGKVFYQGLACQPCYQTRCPLIHHHCLETITVEEVYQEVKKYLKDEGRGTKDDAKEKSTTKT